MIFNDVDAKHLGSGVVLFESAIDIDWDYIREFSRNAINQERSEMYEPAIDPETGDQIYINKSGYFFKKESVDNMPGRGSAIHRYGDEKVKEIFNFIEAAKDKYLFKYFELFPLAYKCVWWKVKGHIVQYKKNVYLGSHSDVSADFIYDVWTPKDQLATRNVISNVFYLNSCVDSEEELDGTNFTGGHHYFNYLDIDIKPQKGDLLFFPSNFMAAHEVKPVEEGERYSYLGWYSHGTPNKEVGEFVVDPLKDPEQAKTATNLYMPNLVSDYREYLTKKGYDQSSEQYNITRSNY
jgi:hypothetical protein